MAPTRHARPAFSGSWCSPGWAGGLLALAAIAAYAGSFSGAFVFDDLAAIARNPTLRHFSTAFSPPVETTVGGRPLVNLSLALNYAISRTQVWSYHAFNLLIHILAGLTLFGILRRTLERVGSGDAARLGERDDPRPYLLAFIIALWWIVHPLQTEAVTYVVQRAESLMGLFYLLTLYCFIRGVTGGPWLWLSVLCCLLGMATKEVMVTAPVMVLLYDRTFVSGSFREAWRLRRRLYLGLAASWLLLGWLMVGTAGRGGTAGFGTAVPWWAYALTQFRAVAHYLRLSFWPHPLVADYGRMLGGSPPEVAFDLVIVGVLVGVTLLGLWRRPQVGFIGAWFFLILAPSSSVVPVATEIIAEHRMYLPLAAVLAAAVLFLDALLTRIPWLIVCGVIAAGLGLMTARRNEVYRSSLSLWADTVAKVPENAGAHNNYGNLLFEQGSVADAIVQYREALRLVPEYADAHYNLGLALAKTGQLPEAIENYQAALRFRPDDAHFHNSYGLTLLRLERPEEAAQQFEAAGRLDPVLADAHVNRGNALVQLGRENDAIAEYDEALRLDPGAADVHNNLGVLLVRSGRVPAAELQFQEALRLLPDYREARDNLERLQALERARSER
jgi:protein O-mannosyl-transferase